MFKYFVTFTGDDGSFMTAFMASSSNPPTEKEIRRWDDVASEQKRGTKFLTAFFHILGDDNAHESE